MFEVPATPDNTTSASNSKSDKSDKNSKRSKGNNNSGMSSKISDNNKYSDKISNKSNSSLELSPYQKKVDSFHSGPRNLNKLPAPSKNPNESARNVVSKSGRTSRSGSFTEEERLENGTSSPMAKSFEASAKNSVKSMSSRTIGSPDSQDLRSYSSRNKPSAALATPASSTKDNSKGFIRLADVKVPLSLPSPSMKDIPLLKLQRKTRQNRKSASPLPAGFKSHEDNTAIIGGSGFIDVDNDVNLFDGLLKQVSVKASLDEQLKEDFSDI